MTNLNMGEIIGKAFDFAKSYGLPMAAILFAASVIGYFLSLIFNLSFSGEAPVGVTILFLLLFLLLLLVINVLIRVSIFASILKILREEGGSYRFNHGLSASVYVKFVVCQFIYGLVVILGQLFFILPGAFVAVRWFFAPLYLIDHPDAGIGEALQASWEKTKGHYWQLFGLGFLSAIIVFSGVLLCFIGVYFTLIISYAAQVIAYRMLWKDDEQAAEEDQFVRFGRDDLYV